MTLLIDSHSHWLPEEIITNAHFFHKGFSDIEAQLKIMDEIGIRKAVLSYPSSDAHLKLGNIAVARIYNDNVAKILKCYPDRFIGAAVLPIDNSTQILSELKRATQELGFKAISLSSSYNGRYLDEPVFLPLFKQAQKEGYPIFVHSQIVNPIGFERVDDPLLTPVIEYIFDITVCIGKLLMSGIFKDYPEVKFIFANFGGATPFLKNRFDGTYSMLRSINFVKDLEARPTDYLKNIYVDTGGDSTKANFLICLELFGSEHTLWGSDWPGKKNILEGINALRDLNISEEDKENILGGNLERLFSSNA
ncbi:MAG: amidohydrolase family protein [Candidatus Omnitrophota bacterium]|nr:amidohydrolase family protein [Candidatus Omnitrophota bacterium]